MKKIFAIIVVCIATVHTIDAQNFEWAISFGGSGQELCESSALDASGNVYTTGYFHNTVDFDPGAGTANLTAPGVSPNIFVQKMDPSGNFLWAKSFGGEFGDFTYDISIGPDGNVYTTGHFVGTADFDPGTGTTELTSVGGLDIFVQKMDPSGNFLWAKVFGGTGWDESRSISTDNAGNVYITGQFEGTADFDPGVGTMNLTAAGNRDIFVQKLDPSGNFIWAKSFGGTDFDGGLSLSVDAAGNVYTTGYHQGTADLDPSEGVDEYSSAGFKDIFIQKMDASGNFLWAKTFGGTASEEGVSIALDAQDNIVATGQFGGTIDFDPGDGVVNITATGALSTFVLKLDGAGDFLWAKEFGGSGAAAFGKGVCFDQEENVYVTGVFSETVDFDPGTGQANLSSNGAYDMFVQKMDASGNFQWAVAFGGIEFDWALTTNVDDMGSVYTTGWYSGTIDFDPGAGTTNLSSFGNGDIFAQKLSQDMTTGIFELGQGIEVTVYPNPNAGSFLFSIKQAINDVEITLTDMQGRVVYEQVVNAPSNSSVEFDGPAGMYLLTVRTPNRQSVIKLIKE